MSIQIKIIDKSSVDEEAARILSFEMLEQMVCLHNTEKRIVLSDFTIRNFEELAEDIEGKNEFLSENITSISFSGEYTLYDKSLEALEVNKLSVWAKMLPHEKNPYRSIEVRLYDNLNNLYHLIEFRDVFVVEFEEEYKKTEGVIKFFILIRSFDRTEIAVKM